MDYDKIEIQNFRSYMTSILELRSLMYNECNKVSKDEQYNIKIKYLFQYDMLKKEYKNNIKKLDFKSSDHDIYFELLHKITDSLILFWSPGNLDYYFHFTKDEDNFFSKKNKYITEQLKIDFSN